MDLDTDSHLGVTERVFEREPKKIPVKSESKKLVLSAFGEHTPRDEFQHFLGMMKKINDLFLE